MSRRIMSPLVCLAVVVLALACGCSQPEAAVDPTTESLAQLRAHNYDDAIRYASEAIQKAPKEAAPYLYRGRAYYYRAGMGDAHRAIEDLSQAIKLAPDSSDAYYTRALIYRELGQTDLADKDDASARNLDHLAKEVYDKLPDNEIAEMKPIEPKDVMEKPTRPKSAAEMLKESSTADGGDAGAERSASGGLPGSLTAGSDSDIPAPVESEFNKQYRALLGQGVPGDGSAPVTAPTTDVFGRPLGQPAPTAAPLNPTNLGAAPLPTTDPRTGASSQARGAGAWSGVQAAPLQSPFGQRAAPLTSVPSGMPTVQTPFPQAARGATGYVPTPVSPFGGAGGQASGAASRPFNSPATTARPQNSAVRPLYPRDYVP